MPDFFILFACHDQLSKLIQTDITKYNKIILQIIYRYRFLIKKKKENPFFQQGHHSSIIHDVTKAFYFK